MRTKIQWDYIGIFYIENEPIAMHRTKVARWINPFTDEIKDIELDK